MEIGDTESRADGSGVVCRVAEYCMFLGRFPLIIGEWRNDVNVVVYLSGEIHSDWREQIVAGIDKEKLPVDVLAPVTDHPASDDVGVSILGEEDQPFWKDHKGGKINAIRTRTMIEKADVVVVRFGEKYKQWNAAFDDVPVLRVGIPRGHCSVLPRAERQLDGLHARSRYADGPHERRPA